jgi:hypothetical protein
LPPNLGSVVARLRFCKPVPQDLVHADQLTQVGTMQSTAQEKMLQVRVSAECGHAEPPFMGSIVARLRCCEPEPHDFVHGDQAFQAGTTQLIGHAWRLHGRVSV